jgi:hypothetical protein
MPLMAEPEAGAPNGPDTPSAAYLCDQRLRRRPRLLMGGTEALLIAAGDGARLSTDPSGWAILPKERGETIEEFRDRRDRSVLYNAFEEAVDTHVGRVFRNPPRLIDDGPDAVPVQIRGDEKTGKEGWWENLDLMGLSGDSYGREWFRNAEIDGIACTLVDKLPGQDSAQPESADEKQGRRPYCILVLAENLIEATPRYVNGRPRLARVRIRERFTRPDPASSYGAVEVTRVRIYYDGLDVTERPDLAAGSPERMARFEILEEVTDAVTKTSTWMSAGSGDLAPLTFIPLVPFCTKPTGYFRARPPLLNLAESNLEHFRKKSDLDNIMHVVNVPMLYRKGHRPDPDQSGIGAGRMLWDSSDLADAKYIEHNGAAIKAAMLDLAGIEERMRSQALEPTLPKTGNLTATSDALRESKATSRLEAWALLYGDAIELVLDYMMQWQGKPPGSGGCVEVDRDIGVALGGNQGFAQVFELAQSLGLSQEQTARFMLQEAKRYGTISVDWKIDDLLADMKTAPPRTIGNPLQLAKGLNLPAALTVQPPNASPPPPPNA